MRWRIRDPLSQPLMRSSLIKVPNIAHEKPRELFLIEDQKMIQTFPPHAPQKAFTHSIGLWSMVLCSKHFDATCCCHSCKMLPKFAIIIPDQVFGSFSIWSCLP